MPNINAWRNVGETSAFPFREGVSLTAENSGSLPEGLLVDAQIFVPQYISGNPYIGSIGLVGTRISGVIMAGDVILSSFSVDASAINNAAVTLLTATGISGGVLVFGAQASRIFRTLRIGQNIFTETEAGFETSCVFRYPVGVLNNIVAGGTPVSGKVALVEGSGIVMSIDGSEVRIDAVGSNARIEACCESNGVAIKSINNATHDASGNLSFNLAQFSEPEEPSDPRQVLRIEPVNNGLHFTMVI